MDSSGQLRKHVIMVLLVMVFDTLSIPGALSVKSVNVSIEGELADIVERQHMLPSWYYTSADAEHKHGLHSQNRWQQQMAFSKTVYSFQVKEDTLPGTIVGKVETLFESPTPITYSVQEDDGENLFLLSPFSGEFLLSRSLDFETQRFYIITVEVQQGEAQVSGVRVYFNVLDVNDNPPAFSQDDYSASVPENMHAGSCFLSLNVSDKDDGENQKLKLSVVSGDKAGAFYIHSTGSVCLNKELDRENQASYNLTIMARDCVQPASLQLSSTARLFVAVEDVNDNAPLFISASTVRIPEDASLHSVVTTVQAKDEDTDSNGEVLYYLNDTAGGTFSVNSTSGQIHLERMLDRELADTLTFSVTATDRGLPPLETTMTVTVHVDDVNDNDPEFSRSNYSMSVREDISLGSSLFQFQAHDQDIGSNGQVRYKLTPASPFVVDSVRGVVMVKERLDREVIANYTLIMTALDQGLRQRSATATVSIIVLDINDSAPRFSPETLVIHVEENEEEPSRLIHQLSAMDEDLGINSQLTYFMEKGHNDGVFSISPDGMFQILQTLDKEKQSMYLITITAVDSGVPPLTGSLTLQVIVNDVNDNYPQFPEEVYNTIVAEDSPVGTVFAIISASDADEGVSGEIRFSIENLDAPFAIEATTGELFTVDVLDRETVSIYGLTVIASDQHPTQPLSSSVLVTVLIGDINDNWPRFSNSPYVAYVPTELASGSVVCAVRATDDDADMNAELRYSLYGQRSDLFYIDPHSGTVFASGVLQISGDMIINVHVEDAAEIPKFDITTISIRFQNISDFPEMKMDVLSYSLAEDEPVGTLVAVVSAASIRAENVSFYLASGNLEDMFHVDQLLGALTVENPLDYENIKEFSLLIEARDSGLPPFSSFSEIHLNITDVNDNSPQFTQAEYRCEIFENSPPSGFCEVLAIDADSPDYSTVRYRLTEGNNDNRFTLDPGNGLLSTTVSLDRETVAVFNLTVEASEPNNPFHNDGATVIVTVKDRNDNAPRFSQIFYANVPEDAPVGHTIIQVTSTDEDTDANAAVNYYILYERDKIVFDIESTTGYITVQGPLDREARDHFVLKVCANDSAWSVSTDVTVFVSDVNDNRPVFSHPPYAAVLPETQEKDTFVLQVLATDADTGQNSELFYVVEPPNEEFWVNASSGEIYTKQPLHLHNTAFKVFDFTVLAFDSGDVPLFSNTTVTVRLEQFNHHPPMFLPVKPLVAIPYHLPVGTEVVQLTATDLDVNSGTIEYDFYGGNASDFFRIEAGSGKVFLNRTLSGSEHLCLTLSVIAKDGGFPPLTSQTEVIFEITGRNNFTPSFSEPDMTFTVPEDLPVGSVIGKIQAEDKDYGSNGAVKYFISTEKQDLPLSVGEISGLLTLIGELDFENESILKLQIKAKDGGWVSKTGTLNVPVIIADVNDNPPVFSSSEYITSLPENSEIGTIILEMMATDADSGSNAQVFYSLIAGDVDKFAIDSRNGTITSLVVFDYEREQSFDVTIKASNVGGHTLFGLAHVVIQISDVNEFIPTFRRKEYNFSVFKNVPIGTLIGKVTAIDYDQGPKGQVFYLMFGHSITTGFYIDQSSGEIYTRSNLRKQGNSRIDLKVLAKNSGVIMGMDVDETLVHISVIDTNDAPVFSSIQYEANITEDSPTGRYVITVSALDQDSVLEWNRFFYRIESGNTNFSFSIDPLSGVISVNSALDRELWPIYNLTVTASDNGFPPATGTTNVIVTVGDINDNAPKLTSTEGQVMENQPEGTIVARLNASDSDLPPNQGPFTYWLPNPLAGSAFALTPDGVLMTKRAIDRELISEYRVLVAIRDAGFPLPLSSTTTFHVRVLDENDNPPLPRNIFIEVKYFGSFFQGGMVGNVHPEDPDESDSFTCAIKNGQVTMFTIPNGTCELWSSPFQGEATFNITIEATDQLHFPVNNSVYVNYKGFTNASIDSCVLFYVSSSSMNEFLSNKYLRFVKALDSLFNLQASKTHVFGIKHMGNEILLLAAVKNYNGQYLGREVASGISAGHKKLLEAQSNVTISHITSDPCLTSPCHNGASCNKNIYISQEVAVLESLAVIFVSPQKEILNCTCLAGFMGSLCEDDIDECNPNPCENNGTCENNEGSFHCHCLDGFSGSTCSADFDSCLSVNCQNGGTCIPSQHGDYCLCVPGFTGELCEDPIDHCRSAPCVQGSCINQHTGFSCHCPFGVSGVHCEEHSYGFQELSFMEFPPLDRRTNLISFEFVTVQKNSLLLYNPGGSSSREFMALEILGGMVHFSYDLGLGPVRMQTHKQVADGLFHSVAIRRIGNMGSVLVDNCTDVESDGFCFSKNHGVISERTLDVGNMNMTFGGMRTLELILLHPRQIKSHNFVGCIRNIHVNGILLRPSMALAAFNVYEGCPRATEPACNSLPCKNGGVCHDLWSDYLCQCITPFTGRNCTTEMSEELVVRFNGNDYIEYVTKEGFKRDYVLKNLMDDENVGSVQHQVVISIRFKTKNDGVLLFVLGLTGFITLTIKDSKPVYSFKETVSGHLSEVTVGHRVADGAWHVLSLVRNGKNNILSLDGKLVLNSTEQSIDLTPVSVEKTFLGTAPPTETKLQLSGFRGCVQYVNVGGHTLPFSGQSLMVEVYPSWTLLQPGCSSAGVCLPAPCFEESRVKKCPTLQNRSCICLQNVSEHFCNICETTTDRCPEGQQGSTPLWLVAGILPLFLVVLIICVGLYKARKSNTKSQIGEGTANTAFSFDENAAFTGAVSTEKGNPYDPVGPGQQRSGIEFYCDAREENNAPHELEYYEIGSVCGTLPSDNESVKISWHTHPFDPKHVKADTRRWRSLKRLITGSKKGSYEEKKPTTPSQNKQRLSPSTKRFSQTELMEPSQCLTFEEIYKLNAPLEPRVSTRAPLKPWSSKSTMRMGAFSACETDSTCSESEYRQFHIPTQKKYMQDQSTPPGCILKEESILPVHLSTSPSAGGQEEHERTSLSIIEPWENILEMHLPFSSYVPVFEDIACLPSACSYSCDMQSDMEEVI